MNTRKKGYRLENEAVKFMQSLQCNFARIGMSGQLEGWKGDFHWIENDEHFRGEAKSGSQVPSSLYRWLEKDKSDFLVVKRDRKERLWVLRDKILEKLLRV